MVLGHELLLLMHSRCCRKRGGRAPCLPGALSLDHLPACPRDTLGHAVHSTKDTTALEHLAWAIYDNQLGPGKVPSLSGYETYGQVLHCLLDKAFRRLQAHCLAHTLAVFKPEERMKSVVTVPQKSQQTEKFPMTRDVQQEFAGGDQATGGWGEPLDLEVDARKWMKEHQHSYTDMQLNFWLLLRPLTDGGKESRLLSMWHWASALDLPICPPAPSSLNIGHWLWEDPKVDERQRWIEAYACSLQHIAEASVGWFWTTEGRTMTPEVSNLVEMFMTMTGMRVSPHLVRECWPSP